MYHLSEACGWNCNLQPSQRMGASVGGQVGREVSSASSQGCGQAEKSGGIGREGERERVCVCVRAEGIEAESS